MEEAGGLSQDLIWWVRGVRKFRSVVGDAEGEWDLDEFDMSLRV